MIFNIFVVTSLLGYDSWLYNFLEMLINTQILYYWICNDTHSQKEWNCFVSWDITHLFREKHHFWQQFVPCL